METSLVKQNSDQRRRRVGVLISGTGTKLQALMDQASSPSEIVLVVSNRPGVQGLKRATLAGIQTRVVDHKLYASPAEFDATIDHVLEEFKVALVCLAGFTRILTGTIVKKWNGGGRCRSHHRTGSCGGAEQRQRGSEQQNTERFLLLWSWCAVGL
ncbi:trifunctional purine biosynthetic protein adenosine-3-like isoform X4 [Gouania willdenowi]|uniref:trifunctional purine biosynthetic protein adenosine-3-like isoform X4 n=1 Tax=Gouania willdenowi TaxID=441366 RepID=UPI0010563D19|nr:trifunctional purine biosynthetic protein adenosine-3-like isoform X4 [Gouania willdenowi]